MKLREIAFSRSGDKGDVSNISVFVYDEADYPFLLENVTTGVVAELFGDLVKGTITRYEFPKLHGVNFVLTEALSGGVSHSLRADPHGKAYQSLVLAIDVPDRAPSTDGSPSTT
jgi:hypothetical protein